MSDESSSRMVLIGAVVIVAVAVVWGFSIIGSPSYNRKIRQDRARIADLMQLKNNLYEHYKEHQTLPPSLDKLNYDRYPYQRPVDIERSLKEGLYRYQVKGARAYELCSRFELSSKEIEFDLPEYERDRKEWEHPAGDYCFQFEA